MCFFFSKLPDALVHFAATFPMCYALVVFQAAFLIIFHQADEELHVIYVCDALTAVDVKLMSPGMWHDVNWQKSNDISEESTASILRIG